MKEARETAGFKQCSDKYSRVHENNKKMIQSYHNTNIVLIDRYNNDINECNKIFSESEMRVCRKESANRMYLDMKQWYNNICKLSGDV